MKRWLGGVCIIFLVFTFQVTNIPRIHMHPDEELSYRATRYDLSHVFYYQQSRRDNQAPLWFVSFWVWQQVVGDSEFTSRVMGALTSVLTLAITYRLGRRWEHLPFSAQTTFSSPIRSTSARTRLRSSLPRSRCGCLRGGG